MKGIYILFSGGFDSSFEIMNILDLIMIKNKQNDIEVNLITVEASFSNGKVKRESYMRKRLLDYWKAKYYSININQYVLSIDVCNLSLCSAKTGLTQPLYWLSSLISCIDFSKYNDIEIVFSYICGDQALSYKEEIKHIIDSSIKIAYSETNFDIIDNIEPKYKIKFPLAFVYKEEIIVRMIDQDKFVFDHCTTCENHDEDDWCGKCNTCRNLEACFNNILLDKSVSDDIKDIIKDKMKLFDNKHENCNEEYVEKKEVEG